MPTELVKQLLEAGVHFGHKTSRWNPKMAGYIYGKRCGIYIIDLEKTAQCLNAARSFLLDLASRGQSVIFIGTKKQSQDIIRQEAERCGMFYVNVRWLGGLLTNFTTIRKSVQRLKDIQRMRQDQTFQMLAKKEVARLEKEEANLKKNLSGVVQMEKLPAAVVVVDTNKEATAVREARRMNIPVVATADTNSNPDLIDYPVPANDDAIKSVQIIISLLAEAIIEGRKKFLSYLASETVPGNLDEESPLGIQPAPEKYSDGNTQEPLEKKQEEKKESAPRRPKGEKLA